MAVKLFILAMATVSDGIARIYFGKVNKTISILPRIFSIIIGILEIIVSVIIVVLAENMYIITGALTREAVYLLIFPTVMTFGAPITAGIQDDSSGAVGRRLTIAR